jgi:hypothetical protein
VKFNVGDVVITKLPAHVHNGYFPANCIAIIDRYYSLGMKSEFYVIKINGLDAIFRVNDLEIATDFDILIYGGDK